MSLLKFWTENGRPVAHAQSAIKDFGRQINDARRIIEAVIEQQGKLVSRTSTGTIYQVRDIKIDPTDWSVKLWGNRQLSGPTQGSAGSFASNRTLIGKLEDVEFVKGGSTNDDTSDLVE